MEGHEQAVGNILPFLRADDETSAYLGELAMIIEETPITKMFFNVSSSVGQWITRDASDGFQTDFDWLPSLWYFFLGCP